MEEIKQHKQELLELLSATELVIPVNQNVDAPFPISSQQKRFWVLSQFKGGIKFHVTFYVLEILLSINQKKKIENTSLTIESYDAKAQSK